jgi:hypothetical protein
MRLGGDCFDFLIFTVRMEYSRKLQGDPGFVLDGRQHELSSTFYCISRRHDESEARRVNPCWLERREWKGMEQEELVLNDLESPYLKFFMDHDDLKLAMNIEPQLCEQIVRIQLES